jgi:hypothetical protein
MANRNAVVHQTLLYCKSYGATDFTGSFDAGVYQQVSLNPGQHPVVQPLEHNKVVSGDFVEMTQGEKDAADDNVTPHAFVTAPIDATELSINDANWVTAGTVVLQLDRYGDPDEMRVEAMGMINTTGGAADCRIAATNEDGSLFFGVTQVGGAGSWEIAKHNRKPANIPGKATEYRLQFRNGAASSFLLRGWVLSFIRI